MSKLIAVLLGAVVFGTLIIAGNTPTAAQAYPADVGYVYTFPTSPTLATVRVMMLHNCVIISYPKTWACPEAPPYTYGN